MIRIYAVGTLCALLAIAGCTDSSKELEFSAMPKELADCRVFYVQSRHGHGMTVVRCPNSAATASTQVGQTRQLTLTLDGAASSSTYPIVEE